ncbi:keratin-associated protein 19-2-like [Panonychus citri]|uniref:keratin-associated protein 19-2-like n=1 Tax=Panonychus citri TaxID=50023 RepID=UPI002307C7D5|nr:keratin-associated protein 19-2-like [Panonychus citri]
MMNFMVSLILAIVALCLYIGVPMVEAGFLGGYGNRGYGGGYGGGYGSGYGGYNRGYGGGYGGYNRGYGGYGYGR